MSDKKHTVTKLSVVIALKNEERIIKDCLESVKWADEIIIVDDISTDKSIEICREYTDKIFINDSNGSFHKNKNLGLEKASGNWILSIDADEIIPQDLKDEIISAIQSSPDKIDGFKIERKNYFIDKPINGCGWGNNYLLRLFKNGAAKWPLEIHDVPSIADRNRVGVLKNSFNHYSYYSYEQFFEKFNQYTSRLADEALEKGIKINKKNILVFVFLKPIYWFLKKYIFLKGFKDGFYGFFISLSSALTVFVTNIKLIELKKRISNQ